MCMKMPDGKYLLVKDPNKPTLRTYEVPADAFDDGYSEGTPGVKTRDAPRREGRDGCT